MQKFSQEIPESRRRRRRRNKNISFIICKTSRYLFLQNRRDNNEVLSHSWCGWMGGRQERLPACGGPRQCYQSTAVQNHAFTPKDKPTIPYPKGWDQVNEWVVGKSLNPDCTTVQGAGRTYWTKSHTRVRSWSKQSGYKAAGLSLVMRRKMAHGIPTTLID